MVAGRASRSSPTAILPVLDRPPRHRYQHQCHRPFHGPVDTLVWEDVFPSEIRRCTLEDLVFHLQAPFVPTELCEFLFVAGGQPRTVRCVVGLGLSQPVPQTRLANRQLFSQCGDRLLAQTRKLDRTTTKLQWMRCRHGGILPGGRGHLRSGVRARGSSSVTTNHTTTPITVTTVIGKFNDEQLHQHRQPK